MATVVREADVADAEQVSEVCSRAFRATYESLLPESYILRSISEFYSIERVRSDVPGAWPAWSGYVVAEQQGVVVGAAGGGFGEPGTAELYVIYLEPEKRGSGIGTMLLERFLVEVSARGAHTVRVHVIEGNDLAIPFYEARGFVPVEVAPAYRAEPGENINSVKMFRRLSD